ncbi:MAG: Ubiquinone/menaquinone biosynthesis C-methyltransferase UbiE [Flavobacteriales bacterium]|nr:Ubiquinone/menaquinone biosynthesis C-methyltransferase UbiE [Flavobacteriales bacterium]
MSLHAAKVRGAPACVRAVLSGPLITAMAWYRTWFGTPYYKLLYGHRDEDDAEVWVRTILGRTGMGQGAEVLDMACGRGRHARWFAQAGCRVTGIDLSAESIAEAHREVPSARFAVHDMRTPYASACFDLVVCLFTSLGYFEDENDDRKALAAAYTALRPGGHFVLDFMNSDRVLRELVPMECVEAGGVRFTIARTVEGGMVVKRIVAEDPSGRHCFEERVAALAPDRLTALVREAGFHVADRTDGPAPAPFDPARSQRLVIWARRPNP